jgi:hypothetical protein
MDACDGSVIGKGVGAFVRALAPLLDALIEQLVREQPACLQAHCSPWCIGTNEAVPP